MTVSPGRASVQETDVCWALQLHYGETDPCSPASSASAALRRRGRVHHPYYRLQIPHLIVYSTLTRSQIPEHSSVGGGRVAQSRDIHGARLEVDPASGPTRILEALPSGELHTGCPGLGRYSDIGLH